MRAQLNLSAWLPPDPSSRASIAAWEPRGRDCGPRNGFFPPVLASSPACLAGKRQPKGLPVAARSPRCA